MLAYLSGKVSHISSNADGGVAEVWLDVHGVGYRVFMANSDAVELQSGEEKILYLSESSALYGGETTLYGFSSPEELRLFRLLKDLPGVGAKKALEHFGKVKKKSPDRFLETVIRGDSKMLESFFGFSPKTAEKIVNQLKEKARDLMDFWRVQVSVLNRVKTVNDVESGRQSWLDGHTWEKAKSALVSLGFDGRDSEAALTQVLAKKRSAKDEQSLEELVRLALKEIHLAN